MLSVVLSPKGRLFVVQVSPKSLAAPENAAPSDHRPKQTRTFRGLGFEV